MNLSKDAYFHNIFCIRVHVPVVDFSCNMLFLVLRNTCTPTKLELSESDKGSRLMPISENGIFSSDKTNIQIEQ